MLSTALTGIVVTIAAYIFGVLLKRRLGYAFLNPMLIAILSVMIFLLVLDWDYDSYYQSCNLFNLLVTPATVCLAVPLYKQMETLRGNWRAILGGVGAGVLTSAATVLLTVLLFGMSSSDLATLLPKSITVAIAMGVTEELGGTVAITVVVIMFTGIFGNIAAETLFRWLHIEEPVAQGVALGTASHILGTARAVELGEVQGAMGSLSIVVAGLITVVTAPVFHALL